MQANRACGRLTKPTNHPDSKPTFSLLRVLVQLHLAALDCRVFVLFVRSPFEGREESLWAILD